jgi:small acid-soluble spore protein D (minor alpha/beta-type SASP)
MKKSNNSINVPEARQAMEQFKQTAASEVGVNLKSGYNGDLTSREAGSVGGQMVKDMAPARTIKIPRINRTAEGHCMMLTFIASITA